MSEKRTTIKDVAALAGVSISSISRYLSNPSSVQPFMAYRIKEAINTLNYVPNTFARNLRHGSSKSIGIVVPNLEFFYGKACRAISDYFFDKKYMTLICVSDNDPQKEQFFVQQLIEQQVVGIVITSCGYNTLFLEKIYQKFKNLIMLDQGENIGCEIVTENHEENAFQIVKHVLQTNKCDSLELLFGDEIAVNTKQLLAGVKRALDETERPVYTKVNNHYGCYREDRMTEVITEVSERLDEGRPTFIGFEPDFVEHIVINMNRMNKEMLGKVDIAGYVMRNTINKIGIDIPCVIRNPEFAGITAADLLYKKINDTAKEDASLIHEVSSIYHF